jgi:hypothetical protein
LRKYFVAILFLLAIHCNADVLKFNPSLGTFDDGVLNINLISIMCAGEEITNSWLPKDVKMNYTAKCLKKEFTDGYNFYYLDIIINKVIEDEQIYYGPYEMRLVAKENGALTSWDFVTEGEIPISLEILSKFMQPFAMSFYYPCKDIDKTKHWNKKYNWTEDEYGDISLSGDFDVIYNKGDKVYIKNDVSFYMPITQGLLSLNFLETNGRLISKYLINKKYSRIEYLKSSLSLHVLMGNEKVSLLLDIFKN